MIDAAVLRKISFLSREVAQLAEAVDMLSVNAAAGAEEPHLVKAGCELIERLDQLYALRAHLRDPQLMQIA